MLNIKKFETKGKLKSLADELNEKLPQVDSDNNEEPIIKRAKQEIQDISDKEIEEISKKISKREIEEEKKSIEIKEETLIPVETYIKCAVHLGTKVITPHMRKFVYKRRADGLAVINTIAIDKKLRESIEFLKNYTSENIYLVCKRESGWYAANKFSELTGIRVFTKKYSPGITTNLSLPDFFESDLTIICDPWTDKNALHDTLRLKKPVMALCDTNNYTPGIKYVIPCNNKSSKSIGCILYILAREYCKLKGIPFKVQLEDFTGKLE